MLQKAQSSIAFSGASSASHERMDAAMRGLWQWALIDPGDRVLDMNCGSGTLLQALKRKAECELCGMTPYVDKSRQARSLLPDADILFAFPEDIPWHDEAFDLVLFTKKSSDEASTYLAFCEALRVLKPGGQFLVATPWYPAPIRQFVNRFVQNGDDNVCSDKRQILHNLEKAGFVNLTWHMTDFGMSVVSGWKERALDNQ